MIKLVTFQKRANSLTRSEFEHRWQTIHGPMAAQFPGLRGYMLGFSIEPDEPQADGIAQRGDEEAALIVVARPDEKPGTTLSLTAALFLAAAYRSFAAVLCLTSPWLMRR